MSKESPIQQCKRFNEAHRPGEPVVFLDGTGTGSVTTTTDVAAVKGMSGPCVALAQPKMNVPLWRVIRTENPLLLELPVSLPLPGERPDNPTD